MRSLKNILLIGSTGTIGSAVRKALVARKSAFDKVGVLTGAASLADPKKAEAFQSVKNEGVEIVVAELDDKAGLVKALKGNQSGILCLMIRVGCCHLCFGTRNYSETSIDHRCCCRSGCLTVPTERIWVRLDDPLQFDPAGIQRKSCNSTPASKDCFRKSVLLIHFDL